MDYSYTGQQFGEILLHQPELKAAVHDKAQAAVDFAAARAHRVTGRQAESGHVEDVARGGFRRDRMESLGVFDAPYSAAREFGNKRTGPEGNLRAALSALEHL